MKKNDKEMSFLTAMAITALIYSVFGRRGLIVACWMMLGLIGAVWTMFVWSWPWWAALLVLIGMPIVGFLQTHEEGGTADGALDSAPPAPLGTGIERLNGVSRETAKNAFFANYFSALLFLRLNDRNGLQLIIDPPRDGATMPLGDLTVWGTALFYPERTEVSSRVLAADLPAMEEEAGRILNGTVTDILALPLQGGDRVDWSRAAHLFALLRERFGMHGHRPFESLAGALARWNELEDHQRVEVRERCFAYLQAADPGSTLLPRVAALAGQPISPARPATERPPAPPQGQAQSPHHLVRWWPAYAIGIPLFLWLSQMALPPQPDSPAVQEVRSSVARIREAIEQHPERMKLYATTKGQSSLRRVRDEKSWPPHVEVAYNVFVDEANRMLMHRAMPQSESGDWFEIMTHYFSPDGQTMLFEFRSSSFSSGCAELLVERRSIYYDSGFTVLKDESIFADGQDRPVSGSRCTWRRSDRNMDVRRLATELPPRK
jgi:hypothetical protein